MYTNIWSDCPVPKDLPMTVYINKTKEADQIVLLFLVQLTWYLGYIWMGVFNPWVGKRPLYNSLARNIVITPWNECMIQPAMIPLLLSSAIKKAHCWGLDETTNMTIREGPMKMPIFVKINHGMHTTPFHLVKLNNCHCVLNNNG